MEHRSAINRPAHLLIQLDPPILHVLAASEPMIRALRQPAFSGLERAGKAMSYPAEGIREQDVGDRQVGAEDAAERFEHGHDTEGDTDPWVWSVSFYVTGERGVGMGLTGEVGGALCEYDGKSDGADDACSAVMMSVWENCESDGLSIEGDS